MEEIKGIELYFMKRALEEAKEAFYKREVPIGAVLVSPDRTILSHAHNNTLTLCDPTAHAEIMALKQAAKRLGNHRLPGTSIFVTLEPCLMCLGALLEARVDRLFYATVSPKWGSIRYLKDRSLNKIQIIHGPLERESQQLLRDFFLQRRKKRRDRVEAERA